MEGETRPGRITDVLHDVHLASVGPSPRPQRPERRPESGPSRQLDACGGSAIRELELRSRFQAAGDEVERPALRRLETRPVARTDDKCAVLCANRLSRITNAD